MSFAIAVGTERERKDALRQNADITIINRENLQWLIEKSKMPFDYDMVVLDELSSFKSWQSKRFRSFMKVRPKVKRVVGLTGTPAPNSMSFSIQHVFRLHNLALKEISRIMKDESK